MQQYNRLCEECGYVRYVMQGVRISHVTLCITLADFTSPSCVVLCRECGGEQFGVSCSLPPLGGGGEGGESAPGTGGKGLEREGV